MTPLPAAERLSFRRMAPGDLDAMTRLLSDPDVMRYYPRPKTRDGALAWIDWNLANYDRDGLGLWVIEDLQGRFLGDCGLTWQVIDGQEDLEIGYHLLPEHHGKGLASEGARACRRLAAHVGATRLIAIVHPDNLPSRRVAENAGLRLEKTTRNGRGDRVVVYGADLTLERRLLESAPDRRH